MVHKVFVWGVFSLLCYNLSAQFNNSDEFKKIMSMEPVYLGKAKNKIRKEKCYRYVKKKFPSVANGKIRIIYSLRLKKKLTRKEFTCHNIMDNLEFLYWNSRKFPDNHVYLYDTVSNVEVTYEEGWGFFCSYDYDGSGGSAIEKYSIPFHITVDNIQPDFVFMLGNLSVYFHFLVKGEELYVLSYENKLMTLSDFIENHYDEYDKMN